MKSENTMLNLNPAQRQEAEQLFSRALQCAKNGDFAGAARYYQQSAVMGHPGAQNNLGHLYRIGRGVNRDPQEAVRLFTLSARQGNVFGMRNLAACYLDGVGTDVDFDLAVDWLETAAMQKDNLACAMLAKEYESRNHEDEVKKIFWHKKASEYGNADSSFSLGNYYANKGVNQNLSEAKRYYELAAQNGNPAMKLKVANAFDIPTNGSEPALDLERAEFWFNEVLECGDDSQKLEAAKGLDDKFDNSGKLLRTAFNPKKTYTTYRTLGMNGNSEAFALAAYCSEIGKGTSQSLDNAIMLYEKAGYKSTAEWCKKKKAGKLIYEEYEQRLHCEMPDVDFNPHSQNSEYFSKNVQPNVSEYNGRVYYISYSYHEYCYLCSSDLSGENISIIAEIPDDYWSYASSYVNVNVNETGIYIYETAEDERVFLFILHFSFEGLLINEIQEECEGAYEDGYNISNIFIYDNNVYYVYSCESYEKKFCQIKCLFVDEGRTGIIYDKAASIETLYATDDKLVFFAKYENDDCEESWASGWMIIDLDSGEVECLSNPYCSPENVIDDPEIYDEESPRYNEKHNFDRKIVRFDFARGIFWTKRYNKEGSDSKHLETIEYWEPHSLWFDRDKIVSDMPIWKMGDISSHNGFSGGRDYFDGIRHYYAETYYIFKSSDKFGNIFEWSEQNSKHGKCDQFTVTGKHMYMDIDAFNEKQYDLSVSPSEPLRKGWFKNELPSSVIEQYKNKGVSKSIYEEKKRLDSESWDSVKKCKFDAETSMELSDDQAGR